MTSSARAAWIPLRLVETLLGRTFTAPEIAEAAGLSYRRVDYYTRVGLLSPLVHGGPGSGSRREYDEEDLVRLRLIGTLRDLGAHLPIARRVLEQLPDSFQDWPVFFFVGIDGTVHHTIGRPSPVGCWWISTIRLRDGVDLAA